MIPFGPNLEKDRHVEQGQMTQAYGGIHPMRVVALPAAAAALGPLQHTLDVDEPVALLRPLRRKHTYIGQVQRHLNEVVPRDSSSTPSVPLSSHRTAPWFHDIWGPITAIPEEP